jgi:RNA polymerase sigma factor (sigma-70 family)
MAVSTADAVEDQQLLDRFVKRRDEAAFEALLRRYGHLVWGLCRRILNDHHDADDAFQATFLVLVRKAGLIGRRDLLGPWLYGVAYRIAVRARTSAAKRHAREQQVRTKTHTDPGMDLEWRDLRNVLDEEVQRLPEKYRVPFILCHLEGKTNEEAARLLGCPKGTILSRLARARERLRLRLTRRGLMFSAGGLSALLTYEAAVGAPVGLTGSTLKAALPIVSGQAAGVVAAPVAALIQGELKTMLISKLFTTIVFLLGIGIGGAGVFSYRASGPEAAANRPPATNAVEVQKLRVTVPASLDGIVKVLGVEIKEGEQIPADQVVTCKVGNETKKWRRLKAGDQVDKGQLLGLLDDRLARDDVAIKEAKLRAAEADRDAALKTKDDRMARYRTQEILFGQGPAGVPATSKEDLRAALLLAQVKHYEWVSKAEAVKQAEVELRQAKTLVEMHEIRSPARGVIKTICKQPGEAVRKLEAVLVIQLSGERD